jgi:hypothetical protein
VEAKLYSSQQENKGKLDLLIGLLNKDVLKTLQLLGFNYKEAIGIPFTELCASKPTAVIA